ncbi:YafY family transcriptional regulator [Nocardia yunnanensis]|uniref:YafY family transcriptional regulator n=1 Tax=Nocardia yunnanensis TaxID=2382165 RepID=A0A386ZLU3_9NOCA|nr:YafY family protein [Nocardia yunnanensis]AYF78832.1 YafY family transcriptional regulator [Nocardia yunnanensis]
MRASRLMSILLLLQTRDRVTAQEIADQLEVSVRTVYRDMESLSAAGIPVYGDAGHAGGYRLLDTFRARLNLLTADEAESLFLSGLPSAAADLGLGALVTAANLKVRSALPAELRDRVGRVAERFHLDAPGWYTESEPAPHLTAVADAVWNERALRFDYIRWATPSSVTRTTEPLGLVLKSGNWYLVGHTDTVIRTYRISRITDLHVLADPVRRPPDFDLATYWAGYLASFDQRRHSDSARVRVDDPTYQRLPELLDPAAAQAAHDTATPPDAHGYRDIRVPIESLDRAVSDLLRLGAGAEVLAPEELRRRMAEESAAMARRYR